MKRFQAALGAAALAAALLGLSATASAQCAMCRASVENSAEGRQLAGDLNRAILVMFVAPYAVFLSCATLLFRRRLGAALRRGVARARRRVRALGVAAEPTRGPA